MNFYHLLIPQNQMNHMYWQHFPSKHFYRTPLCHPASVDTVTGRGPHRGLLMLGTNLLVGSPVAGELHITMPGRTVRQT